MTPPATLPAGTVLDEEKNLVEDLQKLYGGIAAHVRAVFPGALAVFLRPAHLFFSFL